MANEFNRHHIANLRYILMGIVHEIPNITPNRLIEVLNLLIDKINIEIKNEAPPAFKNKTDRLLHERASKGKNTH